MPANPFKWARSGGGSSTGAATSGKDASPSLGSASPSSSYAAKDPTDYSKTSGSNSNISSSFGLGIGGAPRTPRSASNAIGVPRSGTASNDHLNQQYQGQQHLGTSGQATFATGSSPGSGVKNILTGAAALNGAAGFRSGNGQLYPAGRQAAVPMRPGITISSNGPPGAPAGNWAPELPPAASESLFRMFCAL